MVRCAAKNRAFSFIELMIASAILSACGLGVMQALSMSAAASEVSADRSRASIFARELLEEARFRRVAGVASAPEEAERTRGGFTARFENKEEINGVRTVRCIIEWERRNKRYDLALSMPAEDE